MLWDEILKAIVDAMPEQLFPLFKELYGKEPKVSAIHAGLECGLFLGKRPDLDCVSFGPNLLDVHSVNEALDLASAQRSWDYLKAILKNCK